MKTVLAAIAATMMLSGIATANQHDPICTETSIKLAFEQGKLNKNKLRPVAAHLEELLSDDGFLDPQWLKNLGLVQIRADITPYSRTVELTNGKKVLKVSLD